MINIYATQEWKKIRKIVLEKNNNLCELCGEIAIDVHHKDWNNKNHDLNNLQPLCKSCHRKEHHRIFFAMQKEFVKEVLIARGLMSRDKKFIITLPERSKEPNK